MSLVHLPIHFVNGEPQSTVAITDRGLAYGDGVFETMLVVRGAIPLWSYHHARLLKGLLYLQINLESQRLRQQVDQVMEVAKHPAEELLVLKLIVTRGEGARGYQFDTSNAATLIAILSPLSIDSGKQNGVRVHRCQQLLPAVPWVGLKTLNQLTYVLAAQERVDTHWDEGFLFSADGHLIEATARNVFLVKDDCLYTPQIDQAGVAGVMRDVIIDTLAGQLGVSVCQQYLTIADILSADEVFITNGISGIWPVIQYEQLHWTVGPVTRSLQALCHGIYS
jgi:4-amino-4-deoxychorismate lyase